VIGEIIREIRKGSETVPRLDAHEETDLVSVAEIADALDMGESTVWLFVKRQGLPRYRTAARGKTTLFRWLDVTTAYTAPVQIGTGQETGKAAA
jgi:hypothetical protein